VKQSLAKRDAEARCGLLIIDLNSGDVAHWVRVEGMVRELYNVAVLPGFARPMALGLKSDEVQRIIAIGEAQVFGTVSSECLCGSIRTSSD
jgi:Domain of unknown function (DUF4915)